MADQKISADPNAGALVGTELIPVVTGGLNKVTTPNDLASFFTGATSLDSLSDAITDYAKSNISLGQNCGVALTSGQHNTSVGTGALQTNSTGDGNCAFGSLTLNVATGINNTGFGTFALFSVTTGEYNIGIGRAAGGVGLTTGDRNICIGFNAQVSTTNAQNQIVIGDSAVGMGDDTAQIGTAALTDVWCGDGTAIIHADGSMLTNLPAATTLVAAKTANYTILASEDKKVFTNSGAAGSVTLTLPSAAAGLEFTIIASAAQILILAADTGDTITNGTSTTASGGNLTSDGSKGALLKAIAVDSTEWYIIQITGSWTVN